MPPKAKAKAKAKPTKAKAAKPAKAKAKAKAAKAKPSASKVSKSSVPHGVKMSQAIEAAERKQISEILDLRDRLQDKASSEKARNDIGLACQGLFRCAKEKNQECLDTIKENLAAFE